jgi:hypothetical protein
MSFYRRCVQRHLFADRSRRSRQYLAKNPALTPKIDTLYEFFPDARIVYLVRNPFEAIPSFASMMEFSWRAVGVPVLEAELREFLLEMAGHWYRYPLERLQDEPEDRQMIVSYDQLVRDPEAVVGEIYRRFGFDMDQGFAQSLHELSTRALGYTSRHDYDETVLGLDRQRIIDEFADILDRFGFDSPD